MRVVCVTHSGPSWFGRTNGGPHLKDDTMTLITLLGMEPAGNWTQTLRLFVRSQLVFVVIQHSPSLAYSITTMRISDAKIHASIEWAVLVRQKRYMFVCTCAFTRVYVFACLPVYVYIRLHVRMCM